MKIKWLGHSCFLLTSKDGIEIITDPFDETLGYQLPSREVDIVTVSHNHFDHNNTGIIQGNYELINEVGEFDISGRIAIKGIKTSHGEGKGDNIVYTIATEGIKICHLGDLGTELAKDEIQAIGSVDVLLIPIGGYYTIDDDGIQNTIQRLNPKIIIPMHYKTEALGEEFSVIKDLKHFLETQNEASKKFDEIEITKENIEDLSGIVILNY